ncbi:MAG: efflux RND transporter permease subunit [Alphaproteobacteria bacterium]
MIRYFAAHPTAATLLMAFAIVIGLATVPTLKRETFPDIPPGEIEVRVPYPGASAEDVEEAVCQRIEDAVDGVNEVEEIRCEAREGIGTAVVEMREGADFDRFLNDVKTEVEAIDEFPEETERATVRQLGLTDFVASIAVTGPMSVPDLKSYCEQVKDRLLLLEAISQVTVLGFSARQIRIEVPAHTLRQYGLSVADIAGVVARQNIDLPSGTIETTERDVLLRFADERGTPLEFEDLVVVTGASGAEIRLGDIATITDRFKLDEDKTVFNGRRACMLSITKTKAEDTLTAVDAAGAFLERERRIAPPGVTFTLTQDVSSIVRDRLNLLLRNGAQGLGLVFLTMWLFFGFRFSFWVAVGLPVSFLGTIFVMWVLGYSINMITMVGLLIAIGLLMDDAIVISENIATQVRKGRPPLEAAVEGARQVIPGVVASFLTTIAIFGPLAFMKGDIGTILKALPVVLIMTLTVSLIEAFLVLPHHLAHSLSRAGAGAASTFRRRFDDGLDWVRERVLGAAVDAVIAWRYLFLGLVIALFLGSIGMVASGVLKFRVFPDIDGNVIEARLLLPQGTPLKRTEEVVARLTSALQRVNEALTPLQPQGRPLVRNVNVRFNKNVDAFETGPHVATVSVDLLDAEVRTMRADGVLARWREETGIVPDVLNINFKEYQIGPGGLAIDIRLRGSDLAELKAASLELQEWLRAYSGVFDISDDLRPGKPEVRLRLREGATALGLDAAGIAAQLRSAFYGRTASEIQVGSASYEVDVRLSPLDQDSLADLDYFTITSPGGRQIPLGTVATLEAGRGFARLARVDGRRTVTVQGDVDTSLANADEIIADTRARFFPEFQARHPSIHVSIEGQAKEGERTSKSVRGAFLIGLIAIYALLSFQFRSYLEPLVVIAAVPLGVIGAVWGHLVMGLDLSLPSAVGLVSLAGVVVNDSILLVTFLKLRGREGMSVRDAAATASRERFRAVLLTSLTTIAGLLPLLTEKSLQAQVLVPLVTSLVFGIIASTLLVLLVVPALYAVLEDFGLTTFETHAAAGAPAQ